MLQVCAAVSVSTGSLTSHAVLQSDHEKHMQRAKEVTSAASSAASGSSMAPAIAQSDAATLYKKQDLSLKEGQTIKYVSKPTWRLLVAAHFQ